MPERTRIVPIPFTVQEYQQLTALCQKSGLSVSEVVRSVLSGVELRERPPDDLRKLYTEINHIGNNINQIARKISSNLGTRADVREALHLLHLIYERMEEIADR